MKKLLLFVSAIASVAYAQKAPRIQTFQELVKAPKVTSEVASEEKILGVTNSAGISIIAAMAGGLQTALPQLQVAITQS